MKPTPRISNLYTFFYGRNNVEVRVDDKIKTLTAEQAREIADNIMYAGGILCGECLADSRVRFVRSHDPTVARCSDCHDKLTTLGAHY